MRRWLYPVGRIGFVALLIALLMPLVPAATVGAATVVVTNTNDSGGGSLRDAIAQANASPGGTIVTFSIPGGGVHRITPTSAMPTVLKPTTFDATTQPGYSGTPLIELYGASAGGLSGGFTLTGGNSTVKGFVLDGWYSGAGTGVNILSSGNTIQANYIGIDPSGTIAVPNGVGINIAPVNGAASATNNLIGGTTVAARNVISANDGDGITINGTDGGNASGNVIAGNYIGLNAAGTAFVKNPKNVGSNTNDIEIVGASNNLIGGTTPGSRNVISGGRLDNVDRGSGILINGQNSVASGNVVQGNYIGTDATGTVGIVNNSGVYIDTAKNTLVGGTTPAARNIIAAGNTTGVQIDGSVAADGSAATGNVIEGNYIGTDVTGTVAIGNNDGVAITVANDNVIGGTAPGAGNLISGNRTNGVLIESPRDTTGTNGTVARNTVAGNLIGTNAAGTAAIGNPLGVSINGGVANTIGGTTAAARNVITGFTRSGVLIFSDPNLPGSNAFSNVVEGNFIGTDITGVNNLNNGQGSGVYIDTSSNNHVGDAVAGAGNTIAYTLRGVAVVNAVGDAILGNAIFASGFRSIDLASGNGNNNEPAPVLTGAASSGPNQITVTGSLNSTGAAPFRIEFFSTPIAASESRVYLGATNSNGGAFSAVVSAAPAGQYVTATATDAGNNTSTLSNARIITAGPPAIVTPNPGTTPQSTFAGDAFAPLSATVRDANGNALGAGIVVTFTAPGAGASGTFSNGGTTIQVATNANGIATAPFTSNLVGGTYRVTASAAGTTSAVFVLTNAPHPAPPSRPGPSQPGTPNLQPGPRPGPPPSGGQPAPAPGSR
jgi:hypothetical protein